MRHRNHRTDTGPLRLVGLDRTLSREQLDQLAVHTDIVRIGAGETLASAGRVARQFLAVIDGDIEIHDRSGEPRAAGPGTHIGADELLNDRSHTETVITRTDCTLIVVFGPAFRAIARPTPPHPRAHRLASRRLRRDGERASAEGIPPVAS